MQILYGLGNAGKRFRDHRHNTGRRIVERYLAERDLRLEESGEGVRWTRARIHGHGVLLAVPDTYINHSGRGFRSLLSRSPDTESGDALVVYDDLDLETGALRIRETGGDGGHRGMRSILQEADTDDVPRMRIGIGRPPDGVSPSDYVLQPFSEKQKDEMQSASDRACRAIDRWLRDGLRPAMNEFNKT